MSRILSRLVYGETSIMKRYADALVPALVHFVLASSTALADTLHPHLFPNGLQVHAACSRVCHSILDCCVCSVCVSQHMQ